MRAVLGIDVGGTKIAGVLLDAAAEAVLVTKIVPTRGHEGPDAVLRHVAALCRELCDEAGVSLESVRAVGVGLPAAIDYEAGAVTLMPNLPGDWYRKPAAAALREHLNLPVWLINDARAFTLAEARLGAGRGYPVVACFTLGTGIGGGIAINGELHMGMDGAAGEFGHQCVDVNGAPDNSGTPGALEGYASGPALAALGAKAVMQGTTTGIGALVEYDLNRITPRVIMQAAEAGDAVALDILDRVGKYLGAGVGNVMMLLSPHCVIIGGGVAQLGEWILRPLRESLRQYVHTIDPDRVRIVTPALGENAGAIGAALWGDAQQAKHGNS